ncbi:MAG TPA: pyridoxal phosphate-dependent aminotransferase, partial [Caldithrix sp.]|nr:pyridoxal phosphate-dependent aminotransferase [Caldithrix sp.]
VRLHIGDSYLPPAYHLPLEAVFLQQFPDFYRYCNTFGVEEFRRALVRKLTEDNQLPVTINNILVTSGATNALSSGTQALLNPGEEVVVLTPCWPFFPGMVKMADGVVTEVPFYTSLYDEPDLNITYLLDQHLTEKTVALYLNTPNNPSGKVLTRHQFEQIAAFARAHRLWIISDEAYDGLTFDTHRHISVASLAGMFEQTISIFTFSKSFMFAGLRLGFLAAAEPVVKAVNKCMVHQLYSPPTITQQMMIEALSARNEFIPRVRQHYQDLRDLFLEKLRVKVNPPEGTYFLFFPVDEILDGRDYQTLINQCLESGVSVAPGGDFGKDFGSYIRLCFTGESQLRLETAIERLNEVFFNQK